MYCNLNYDKHKEIWWAWANVGEWMTWDDFLLQDITYLDRKHKRGTWRLHTNSVLSIQSWVCVHPNDVFYVQDVSDGEWDSSLEKKKGQYVTNAFTNAYLYLVFYNNFFAFCG